ncbi:MAG: hypothetical protein E6R03_17460 [Hyphomicrobiaceae bacterium]|nr:MAG: hypothetical protein E6R03_17460 [Hyphomicrobiaceae bacterium]
MDEIQKEAQRRYDAALKRVQSQPTVSQGAIRVETEYIESYQGLVNCGLAPQIKAKYRNPEVAHQRRAG